jgi:uncharacterized protein HemX
MGTKGIFYLSQMREKENMSEEIKALLNRVAVDTSDLVERVARLEAEVNHLVQACPEMTEPVVPPKKTMKVRQTIWTWGPSGGGYDHV